MEIALNRLDGKIAFAGPAIYTARVRIQIHRVDGLEKAMAPTVKSGNYARGRGNIFLVRR